MAADRAADLIAEFGGSWKFIGVSIALIIFWIVFSKKLSNRKIQLSRRAGWQQIKGEIGAALLSMLGNTLFASIIFGNKILVR